MHAYCLSSGPQVDDFADLERNFSFAGIHRFQLQRVCTRRRADDKRNARREVPKINVAVLIGRPVGLPAKRVIRRPGGLPVCVPMH